MDVVDKLPETLPDWIVKDYGLPSYAQAIQGIHFPNSQDELEAARRRLGFDELFIVMMAVQLIKDQTTTAKALAVPFKQSLAVDFVAHLPFKLTDAQRKLSGKYIRI